MIYRRRVTAARPRWQTHLFNKIWWRLSARWKYNGRQRTFTQISAGLTGDNAPDNNGRLDGAPAQHMYSWIICQINSAYMFRCSVPTLSMLIFHPDCSIYGSCAVRGRCFSGPHPVLSDNRLHRAAGVQGIWGVSLWHPPDWPLLLQWWGRPQCLWTSRSGHRVAAARFSIRTDRGKGFAGIVEGQRS